MDHILRATAGNGSVRIFIADTHDTAQKSFEIHRTSPVMSAAMGRALTAVAIMGSMLKAEGDLVSIQIKGDGPGGGLTVTSDSKSRVKGYPYNPMVDIPLKENGKLDVQAALGYGTLTVIKDMGLKEPYVGQIPLVSGEIAEDITAYFAISEQVPTVCALGVLVNPDLTVRCAGGFIVQLLPGATEEEIDHLEKNIKAMPSVTAMLEQGMTVRNMLDLALEGFQPDILDSYHVAYRCDCSMERVEGMLHSLGKKEVEKLRDEDPVAEVNCQFCDKVYRVDLNELLRKWPASEEKTDAKKS